MSMRLTKKELGLLTLVGCGFAAAALLLVTREQMGLAWLIIGGVLLSGGFSLEVYRRMFALHRDLLQEFRQIQAHSTLLQVLKPSRPLPELRAWAVTPDLALILVTAVFEQKPQVIVECGSGSSTLLMAYALRDLGAGHIFSLEHDVPSKERTEALLSAHGLTAFATVFHAPLGETVLSGESFQWYDVSALPKLDVVDLLFVDGPPSYQSELARYPALPIFWDKLRAGGLMLLDDSARTRERRVAARWRIEFPAASHRVEETQKGTVIIRKN